VTTFRDAMVYAVPTDGGTPVAWSQPSLFDGGTETFRPQVAWRTIVTSQGLAMVHQYEQLDLVPDPTPCMSTYGSNGLALGTVFPALTMLTGQLPQPPSFSAALSRDALPVDISFSDDGWVAIAYAAGGGVQLSETSNPGLTEYWFGGGQPVALAFNGNQLLVFSREPAQFTVDEFTPATATTVVTLSLSSQTADSTGHDLFHQQTHNGIACASCHPEATDDGHVWHFVPGLRRTPTLRGGLTGTEPFHWAGDEHDFGSLMSDVFVNRMGGTAQDSPHTQAVLAWLDAQPERPAPTDLDIAAVTRGQASFIALGCSSCHAGTLGTDNLTVDIGTGGTFQVPRLAELAYSAPFFHDGSITALADRFTAAGGSGHSATSGLTADQISDLVAYLKSR